MPFKDEEKRKIYLQGWQEKNRLIIFIKQKAYRINKRIAVLLYYGKGRILCSCCEERRIEFLAVDHIDGGGSQQRRFGAHDLYFWIVKNKYPSGFRVLCHNCNLALGFYGTCAHKKRGIIWLSQ